jgi:hypothetical protein
MAFRDAVRRVEFGDEDYVSLDPVSDLPEGARALAGAASRANAGRHGRACDPASRRRSANRATRRHNTNHTNERRGRAAATRTADPPEAPHQSRGASSTRRPLHGRHAARPPYRRPRLAHSRDQRHRT